MVRSGGRGSARPGPALEHKPQAGTHLRSGLPTCALRLPGTPTLAAAAPGRLAPASGTSCVASPPTPGCDWLSSGRGGPRALTDSRGLGAQASSGVRTQSWRLSSSAPLGSRAKVSCCCRPVV